MGRPQIRVTLDQATYRTLVATAKSEGVSLSKKAEQILVDALSLEEDNLLGELAQQRMTSGQRYISHKTAWS